MTRRLALPEGRARRMARRRSSLEDNPVVTRFASLLALALTVSGCGSVLADADQRSGSQPDGFIRPARRPGPPAPAAPVLPPQVANVPAYTLTVAIDLEGDARTATRRTRVVSRTTDRVHVSEGRDSEWFFRRNPIDPARVSGILVDHRAQRLVGHEESDLRNLLGISGWADVVSLGFDHTFLAEAAATTRERQVGGVRFVQYTAPTASFWWSAEAGLATEFTQQQGTRSLRVTIETLSPGVNGTLLLDPVARFPAYEELDVAEWLEQPAPTHRRP